MPSLKNMFVAVPLTEIKEQNIEYQKLSREYELLATAFEMLTAKKADPEVVVPLAEMAVTMQTPISDLDLSVRSFNCLKRAGKNTLRDIVEMTEDDLLQIRNLGRKSAEEIIGKIKSYGLDLSK
ncbi:MAG: DNA-directed RNA polymerase subunit alpha C-terminal domain-containing protein [Syntrophomonadales bacterium]